MSARPVVLLVEEVPDLGLYEAGLLERSGYRVIRCSGEPAPFAACPMMRTGACPLAASADLIVFSMAMFRPLRGKTYRGEHLLRAYRDHPVYGRKPMVVVTLGAPGDLGGLGPVRVVDRFSDPDALVSAVFELAPPSPEVAAS